MRERQGRLLRSIERLEARAAEQGVQLSRMNRAREFGEEEEDGEEEETGDEGLVVAPAEAPMTEEDLRRDEEEVRELERKKRGLEDRVSALGKDITGVLR